MLYTTHLISQILLLLQAILLCIIIVCGTLFNLPSYNHNNEPLYLTSLIKSGKIKEAQNLSRVTYFTDVESYSGYFTTNEYYNSNIFFWFFPAVYNSNEAPLLLWLNGGPGSSSLFGLFVEHGPFRVDGNNNLFRRTTSWTLTHSVIYIDSPVGTGFSFTDNDQGYATDQESIADALYSTLKQFFIVFPEYKSKNFYLSGESYAGKYLPSLAYKIHKENSRHPLNFKINLQGISIGNGFCDPENSMDYGEVLYNFGLLDENSRRRAHHLEHKIKDLIAEEKWVEAYNAYNNFIGYQSGTPNFFNNATGVNFYYNFLVASRPPEYDFYETFVNLTKIRRALHVGNRHFIDGPKVINALKSDIMKSIVPTIEYLLNAGYRVLIYNGQLDIIVANKLTENFVRKLQWYGALRYLDAKKNIWREGKDIAGYSTKVDNFTRLLIRDAGHIVPYDQPKWSLAMITRFTSGKDFQ